MTLTRYTSIACGMVLAMVAVLSTACNNTVTITGPGLESSLIHYYPFDGDAYDDGSDPKDPITFSATLVNDRLSEPESACSLDSSGNDYIELSYFSLPETCTICAWIRTTDGEAPLLRWESSSTGDYETFGIISNKLAYSQFNGTSTDTTSSSNDVNDSSWKHVAVVKSETAVTFYIDGTEDTNISVSYLTLENMTKLYIGKDHGGSAYFDGIIDEIRIYNKALTDDEVTSVYEM